MICRHCAEAADLDSGGAGHAPEICLDHGKEIRACGCQHKPVERAAEDTLAAPLRVG